MKGSDWLFSKVLYLEVHRVLYSPLSAGSFIKEPDELRNSKCIINIKNSDQKCFLYSVLAKLFPVNKNANRVYKYRMHEQVLNMTGITYPVSLSQIPKFEKQNDISINVFGYEEKEIFPMKISKIKRSKHVDLLYLKDKEKVHYCLIRNLNRFLYRTSGMGCRQHFYCPYCLHGFIKQRTLEKHRDFCMSLGEQKIEMPTPGENDIVEFSEIAKQLRVPYTIYADMETYVIPVRDDRDLDPNSSHTKNLSEFVPCGFCYQVVCSDDRYSKPPVLYRGKDVVETFLNKLLQESDAIMNRLKHIEPMHESPEIEREFKSATHCHICKKAFDASSVKVRNHNHINGKFLGLAHRDCNLQYQQVTFIPVVLHNLRGFDGHLIMQHLGKYKSEKLNVIANTQERYISFSVSNLRFIDSFQFLDASLETLVENLKKSGVQHFKQFRKVFTSEEERNLLLRKGVYCYSFVTDEKKFEATELPPKSAFYNDLTKCDISDEDYLHAQEVWQTMNIKDMGSYHDLYLTCDVLLLSDVFERFRDMTISNFDLDPLQYFTLAGLCWSACLKMSEVQLELITDLEQYLMIEKGTRGGVSMITTRYAKANNPYIPETYDSTKPNVFLGYFDMNNLYGGVMCEPLPVGDFRWLSRTEIDSLYIGKIEPYAMTGYILEVTLSYPKQLHELHSDYPLAPESTFVRLSDLSPYNEHHYRSLTKTRKTDGEDKIIDRKLIPTLRDKVEYVLHYRYLQFYLEQGLELKKIHRVIAFTQKAWLKPYIEYNTKKRQMADNKFEIALYKAYNNIVLGKTMENIRLHMNFKLVNTKKGLLKLTSKPSFERVTIFNEDLVGVKSKKVKLLLNKPIYTGMTVLDLSKMFMYNFHYNCIRKRHGLAAKLLMTDTDSLFYSFEGIDDLYKSMELDIDLYDTFI
ncbi:hypothetical protein FSP39_021357 [Pinctada imbricata]|uniref:DNA-directed DNA polymerase n=1 Tax=Pinctada imbricata TaxID=66713 RepID=A0AA89CB47_PINIB|nr:hypothetical protein FSP39_021357 [Pinctada imbricata]